MSSSVTPRPQCPQPRPSESSNTARSTDEGMTAEVDKATKVNLGIPSEHEPRAEADYDEVHGTEDYPPCLYPQYLPVWENPQAKSTHAESASRYGPLEPFNYAERALAADSTFRELLPSGSELRNLTATLGAEVSGVQLSALSDRGKDQLALLANEKKVLGIPTHTRPQLQPSLAPERFGHR
ncbi:hypothetical protein E4U37_000012 [Claviceps purpurea]|nr:hypothetical protein E4U37_000012 [Claviceps purpurea]